MDGVSVPAKGMSPILYPIENSQVAIQFNITHMHSRRPQEMRKDTLVTARVYTMRESILLYYGTVLQPFTGLTTFVMIFTNLRSHCYLWACS